jgi:hypothetical protein
VCEDVNENTELNVEHLNDRLKKTREIVKKNIEDAYMNYSKNYNLRTRNIQFQIGQVVWKKRFRQSKAIDNYNAKLDDLYEPVTIIKRLGSVYEVKNAQGKNIGTVHAKDLKP